MVFCMMMIFMIGIWLTDLGSSGMAIEDSMNISLIVHSLVLTTSPSIIYHVGLVTSQILFLLLCVFFVYQVIKDDE